jgi:NAD(P)-dependent dehydrogenase (short-subunit alcohol dehydrogenase family)
VRSFARTWTLELRSRKIRINVVSPGPIDTPGLNNFIRGMGMGEEQIKKAIISSVPMGRMGAPDEVASAVLFLASDDSSFVTGVELFVDGGMAQI